MVGQRVDISALLVYLRIGRQDLDFGVHRDCTGYPMGFIQWYHHKITIGVWLLVGWVHDSSLAAAGVMIFTDGAVVSPVWLWYLWVLMGMTLNYSLSWVCWRPWISALLGSIFEPLAYAGGIALSDAEWGVRSPEAFAIMAPVWLLVLPSIRIIAHRIESLCR